MRQASAGSTTVAAQIRFFSGLPAHAVRTVTADNGTEFAWHHVLADILTEINNHPRKVLDWHTPAKVFEQLCSQPPAPCCTAN